MISAGFETTVNLLGQAVYQLLTRPELLSQVRAGTVSWAHLIEETLRYAPPVSNLPLRYAITDIDVDDQQIKAGEAIITSIAAANRSLELYGPDADEFDPSRTTKDHVSFGYGVHHCLGAPLARMEAEIALPALFERFPELALAEAPEALKPLSSFISQGHQSLPVYSGGQPDADAEQ
ncbi:cytochrome P450 [Nocardia higoensis]|uniref:cytochrome P450 n=1 Tax=Nocardia higoensis TaxID=228599 RepID=UPI0002DC91B6|nr:cytochrome P450 [Nocardia higoensis]